MTREEEIQRKAGDLADFGISHGQPDQQQYYKGFIDGAKWADQHPRKELWDAEKVVEWILNNYGTYEQTYTDNSGNHTYSDFQVGQFIRNLREAMED